MVFILYWARLAHHSDAYSEGYIGITKDTFEQRKASHKSAAKKDSNIHFHNALKKYGNRIVWSVLHHDLSEAEALQKEEEYRPDFNIGWNTDKGGYIGVSPEWYDDPANAQRHRQKTSEATKRAIAEKDTAEARSARAVENWSKPEYRKKLKGRAVGERNAQYGKFGKNHPAAGHTKTPEGIEAIRQTWLGKKHSKEAKNKMSQSSRRFSDQQQEEMHNRKLAGEHSRDIAADFNCTREAIDWNVRKWRAENGFEFLLRKRNK